MRCLHPITISNPVTRHILFDVPKGIYGELRDNIYKSLVHSKFPAQDPFIEVPCGHCEACLTTKSNQWAFRLFNEWKNSSNCFFITLTYSDGFLPYTDDGTPCFAKKDCQQFVQNMRNKYGRGLRYFLVSEYGSEGGRPHYHLLLFNLPIDTLKPMYLKDLEDVIFKCWLRGQIMVDECKDTRIIYCAKYCLSSLDWTDDMLARERRYFKDRDSGINFRNRTLKNFILSSRKPGIGHSFLSDSNVNYYRSTCDTECVLPNGISYPMARYYKDKIFDDEMKEKIKERIALTCVDPTDAEKAAFKHMIHKKFKKSPTL